MANRSADARVRNLQAMAKVRRKSGVLALSVLMGGVSGMAAAGEAAQEPCTPLCQHRQWLFAKLDQKMRPASPVIQARPMATFTVTTTADLVDPADGKLSLREAVDGANGTPALDAIGFAPALAGQTLVLTGGQLTVSQDLRINGRGDDGVAPITIDGGGKNRVLFIGGAGTDVVLRDLRIVGGYGGEGGGGGIRVGAANSLQLMGVEVSDNSAGGYYAGSGSGGGIHAEKNSRLIVNGSTIAHNLSYDLVVAARSCGGGIYAAEGSVVSISGSTIASNRGTGYRYGNGGGLCFDGSTIEIKRSTITGNVAGGLAGGILAEASRLTITDSTIGANDSGEGHASGGRGGGIVASGTIVISNSTMTGNQSQNLGGGGIFVSEGAMLAVNNSIMAGNFDDAESGRKADDVSGTITMSNGHNVFGTDVTGNIAGDRENVAAGTVFAAIDPATGGGKLDPRGIVPLKKNLLSNPALSAADPIIASNTGQLGTTKRPQPTGSLPDIGAAEADQPLSKGPTVNNDVLTGSAAANNLSGLAGNDYLQGLAGKDVLNGQNGSDVLDGGPGNDALNGGTGVDIATFAGSTAVVVDLAAKPATAKRGGETDTLTSIEGIIGSSKADTFKGDAANNEFQGGLGKDTATGGGGRDLYAFKTVADSPAGAGRDVIKDFVPGQDVIDVSDIDADSTTPGQQTFRWVGKAVLTGAAQLGYFVSGGNTIVRASTDADAQPELEIQLAGVKVLTDGDFRF